MIIQLAAAVAGAIAVLAICLAFFHWCTTSGRSTRDIVEWALLGRAIALGVLLMWVYPRYSALNASDVNTYYKNGVVLADSILNGQWDAIEFEAGNNSVYLITALLYLPWRIPVQMMFLCSSFFGLAGGMLFFRAFSFFADKCSSWHYGLILFLMPSVLIWSSNYGKDSLVFLGMGLVTYGFSCWLTHRSTQGSFTMIAGLLLIIAVRPHVGLLTAVSLVTAQIAHMTGLRRRSPRSRDWGFIIIGAVAVALAWRPAAQLAGIHEASGDAVVDRIILAGDQTAFGDSAVDTPAINGFTGFFQNLPTGALRVLFRPWPWEAHNVLAMITAAESLTLLGICIGFGKRLVKTIVSLASFPFGVFSLCMTVLVIALNSTIPNLGITARMKTQLMPFLLILLLYRKPALRNKSVAGRSRFPFPGLSSISPVYSHLSFPAQSWVWRHSTTASRRANDGYNSHE
jgi:hypothetical protein